MYTVWAHVAGSGNIVARYTLLAIVSLFGLSTILQALQICISNGVFRFALPRARMKMLDRVVRLTIDVSTCCCICPGQYVNVWVPGVSFWSFLQSHPFVVAAAQRHKRGTTLELVMEPRRGWTLQLAISCMRDHADNRREGSKRPSYLCLFSGPHGRVVSVDSVGTVVLAASGWGLIGLLPYLQQLIRGRTTATVKARRVHLIWQLEAAGKHRAIRRRKKLN